jgi:hypothetical protein
MTGPGGAQRCQKRRCGLLEHNITKRVGRNAETTTGPVHQRRRLYAQIAEVVDTVAARYRGRPIGIVKPNLDRA